MRIVNRHEEFYACIMLIVEKHYLEKHSEWPHCSQQLDIFSHFLDVSFSENSYGLNYGLKRRRRPYIEMDSDRASAAVAGPARRPSPTKARHLAIFSTSGTKAAPFASSHSTNFQIGIPYLRAKAQDYFEQLGSGSGSGFDEGLDPRQIQALTDQVRSIKLISGPGMCLIVAKFYRTVSPRLQSNLWAGLRG